MVHIILFSEIMYLQIAAIAVSRSTSFNSILLAATVPRGPCDPTVEKCGELWRNVETKSKNVEWTVSLSISIVRKPTIYEKLSTFLALSNQLLRSLIRLLSSWLLLSKLDQKLLNGFFQGFFVPNLGFFRGIWRRGVCHRRSRYKNFDPTVERPNVMVFQKNQKPLHDYFE